MDRSKSVYLESCEGTARLETESPAGASTRDSPTLRGVYVNATWAENVRTITHELLGPSDGRPDQTFVVLHPRRLLIHPLHPWALPSTCPAVTAVNGARTG